MTNNAMNQETPLPGTANDTPEETGDQPGAVPTETTPAEAPVMDPGSEPAVSFPAQ